MGYSTAPLLASNLGNSKKVQITNFTPRGEAPCSSGELSELLTSWTGANLYQQASHILPVARWKLLSSK
jgi:hypothetical protein